MRKVTKNDSFFLFYYVGEGRGIVHLAELFLKELAQQIASNPQFNFTKDYYIVETPYLIQLNYVARSTQMVQFFVRDLERNWNVLELECTAIKQDVHIMRADAYFPHKRQWRWVSMEDFPIFLPLISSLKQVVMPRLVEVQLSESTLVSLHDVQIPTERAILQDARTLLQDHRSLFTHETFVSVAHTIKTIEQAIARLKPNHDPSLRLKQTIHMSLLPTIEQFVSLPPTKRAEELERWLTKLHHFYLLAIDV